MYIPHAAVSNKPITGFREVIEDNTRFHIIQPLYDFGIHTETWGKQPVNFKTQENPDLYVSFSNSTLVVTRDGFGLDLKINISRGLGNSLILPIDIALYQNLLNNYLRWITRQKMPHSPLREHIDDMLQFSQQNDFKNLTISWAKSIDASAPHKFILPLRIPQPINYEFFTQKTLTERALEKKRMLMLSELLHKSGVNETVVMTQIQDLLTNTEFRQLLEAIEL